MKEITKPNVELERYKYIGGSDIPIIMGISQFKTRNELLLEKAQLKDNNFEGNVYTEYGNIMEHKIRTYISDKYNKTFVEDTLVKEDEHIRCNVDGKTDDTILEIKTTSQIHQGLDDYKYYLVQLLFYMHNYRFKNGILAIYERPNDFNENFDPSHLTIYEIKISKYKALVDEIMDEVNKFLNDLEEVKTNGGLVIPAEALEIVNKLNSLEDRLNEYKAIKDEETMLKEKLLQLMQSINATNWEMNNGTKITRVKGSEEKVVQVVDEEKLKENYADAYNNCLTDKVISGRKESIRITLKRGDK